MTVSDTVPKPTPVARRFAVALTKIALISDHHLEARKEPPVLGSPSDMFQVYGSLSLPREIDADVLVIAGNSHPDPEIRGQVLTKIEGELGLPVIHVNGTHDNYGGPAPGTAHFPGADGGRRDRYSPCPLSQARFMRTSGTML